MSWSEVQRWTQPCADCGGTREMIETVSDLGYHLASCTRWCACAPYKIVTVHPFPLGGDPEVDPEGSEGGTV